VVLGIGLLFAYYAHAQSKITTPIGIEKTEYSSYPYDLTNNILYSRNYSDLADFQPVRAVSVKPKQNTTFCSCVLYGKQLTGYSKPVGYARNWERNSTEPIVGGVVITRESSVGHIAVITGIQGGKLILREANFTPCKETIGRELDINSPLILGYWSNN